MIVILHAASVLASALLLFLSEPMVAKALLPLYGGSPAVWSTCLLFFQGLLLAGYAYAHFGARWLGRRGHLVSHAALLVAPLALLPPAIPTTGPPVSAWPLPSLLLTLAFAVGAPFFVLASNSSMVQKWHALRSGESPYFLYAASNAGSFLALVAYPFVVEPAIGLHAQLRWWSLGYVAFVALSATLLAGAWRVASRSTTIDAVAIPRSGVSAGRRLRWTVRAAVPSSLLLAVTLAITTDVAAIPLLWVVPLGLYLATFVIAFWPRLPFPRRLLVMLGSLLIAFALAPPEMTRGELAFGLGVPLAVLFVGSWICHADLARDRPEPEHVTEYYLFIAVGGFAGGVFGNLIAPLVFDSIAEYPLSLALLAVLFSVGDDQGAALVAALARPATWLRLLATILPFVAWIVFARLATSPPAHGGLVPLALLAVALVMWRWPGQFAMACACAALVSAFGVAAGVRTLDASRSFFGLVRIRESDGRRRMVHGTTSHGSQQVDPFEREPRSYYTPTSPLARAMRLQPENAHIAVIGLGTGSLAYYTKPGQTLRYYEIDPIIEPLARRWFTFLGDAHGTVRVTLGDARLTLREVPDGSLDLLLVDAFTSDAIPMHLLTVEAIQLYLSKLKSDRVLLLHVSNRHLDLVRVVRAIARELALETAFITYQPEPGFRIEVTALARARAPLQPLFDRGWSEIGAGREVLWTDDRSSLPPVIAY